AWPWWDSLANWVAACAKKRRLATARGISISRARRIGLPASRDSAWAKSSARASSASASFSSQRARTSLGRAAHAGAAARAAATASSTSRGLPAATEAKGRPDAGSATSSHCPEAGSRIIPPIRCRQRFIAPAYSGLPSGLVVGGAGRPRQTRADDTERPAARRASALANRTGIHPASRQRAAHDRRATARAWLALAVEDVEAETIRRIGQVVPAHAACRGDAAAAITAPGDVQQCGRKPVALVRGEVCGRPARRDAGFEQHFGAQVVAHPGQEPLVEEQPLQRPSGKAGILQAFGHCGRIESWIEHVRAELRQERMLCQFGI